MGERQQRSDGSRAVFLSWTTGNRRTADLADFLGIEPKFVCVGTQRAWTAPFRWGAQAVLSIPVLLRPRTSAIVLMMPPYPALLLCRMVARLRRVPLVIDAHSAVFEDSRFTRFLPATLRAMRRSELTIVTNARHRKLLESEGIAVTELHDPPAPFTPTDRVDPSGHVLIPASWHADEPIAELVTMARERPETAFTITGRPSPALQKEVEPLPSNVRLTGFVSDAEYAELLDSAGAICCLTLNDNTMQRGGYEALAKGLPLVTSDFALLREYFGEAAEYAAPDADSIGAAIDRMLADHSGAAERMSQRRSDFEVGYDAGLDPIRAAIAR